jgi:hypothetical protein
MYGETLYSRHTTHTTLQYCGNKLDERGTLKATDHDKYENIAASYY